MGRPLKIAKAQAILTLDTTTATGGIVTVTNDLLDPTSAAYGVTAGMPFVPATTVGTNLVAGTTYWILDITGNSTFTVSATDLSSNPSSRAVVLTNDTTDSVLSVGMVDSGFNNPDNSDTSSPAGANLTFGVVGGNTGIYGKQVLCEVAFGVAGVGTIYADPTVAVVSGIGTTFSSHLSVGSWVGTDADTALGYVSSIGGVVSVTTVAAVAATDLIEVGSGASSLVLNGAIVFAGAIGTTVLANTVYYVKAAPDDTHLSVSATPGGVVIQLDSVTIVTTGTQDTITLAANAAVAASNSAYVYATPEAGYIVRQKGKTKYLVKGGTSAIISAAYTANVANAALTPNTFNIIGTYFGGGTKYIRNVNDYQSEAFPAVVAPSALTVDGLTVYTIYSVGTTDWTAIGAASNMTGISFIATAAGSGTGTAILNSANPDIIATFGTAYAANTYGGQTTPITTIASA